MSFSLVRILFLAAILQFGSLLSMLELHRTPSMIISLPKEAILPILVAKFRQTPKMEICNMLEFQPCHENLLAIFNFMRTNKKWYGWISDPEFTYILVRNLLGIDPVHDVSFDYDQKNYEETDNPLFGVRNNYALFRYLLGNFKTIGVKRWLEKLFELKPKAKDCFGIFLRNFADEPVFLEQLGIPVNYISVAEDSVLYSALCYFDQYPDSKRKIPVLEYILRKTSFTPESVAEKHLPLLRQIQEKIKNETKQRA